MLRANVPKYCTPGSPSWTLVNLFDFMGINCRLGRLVLFDGCQLTRQAVSSNPLFHRWARLLKQRSSISVHHLPTKEKKTSVFWFHLQQTNGSLLFPFSICSKQMKVAILGVGAPPRRARTNNTRFPGVEDDL